MTLGVLDFQINWTDTYKIAYEYKTDIIVSRSGREQRRALRTSPRKSLEYRITLPRSELQRFNRLLSSWHHLVMDTYEATRFTVVSADSPANASTIQAVEIPGWLTGGVKVALSVEGEVGLREVLSIDGTTITFTSTDARLWPAGTRIHPVLSGNLTREIRSTAITNELANATVMFDVEPASEVIAPTPVPQEFDGRELFLIKPNWVTDISWTYEHEIETVDFGRGRIAKFLPIEFETNLFEATYLARNTDEADALRTFFERMCGQLGEFYMPTWTNDLTLRTTAFGGVNTLRIVGSEAHTVYETDTVHRAVAVFLRDGRTAFGKIANVYQVTDAIGSDTVFEMNDLWAFDIEPENVNMICWMPVWRNATDTLTIEWLTESVAQTKLALKTLENLPPD